MEKENECIWFMDNKVIKTADKKFIKNRVKGSDNNGLYTKSYDVRENMKNI